MPIAVNTVLGLLMMDSKSVQTCRVLYQIKLRNGAFRCLLL